MGCRKVRKAFPALSGNAKAQNLGSDERRALQGHLETCSACAAEYRLFSLSQTVLDLTALPEVIEPDKDFMAALRARIARGPESFGLPQIGADESMATMLWLTARQMFPAMALLLLLIIGATLLWSHPASTEKGTAARIEIAEPSADDVIDSTFIVAEERLNHGK
ncbi:MAG: hypothetical protein AB1757_11440 [Acidobacteriota bacterium]